MHKSIVMAVRDAVPEKQHMATGAAVGAAAGEVNARRGASAASEQ